MIYSRNMHQDATYWTPLINDGYGNLTFSGNEKIKCRWQKGDPLVRNNDEREIDFEYVVYSSSDLKIGGRLLLGASNDVEPPEEAKEIRKKYVTQNLSNTITLFKYEL